MREARRHDPASGIDFLVPCTRDLANRRDLAIHHGHSLPLGHRLGPTDIHHLTIRPGGDHHVLTKAGKREISRRLRLEKQQHSKSLRQAQSSKSLEVQGM